MIPIFITSWRRIEFLKQVVQKIHERTTDYELHVYDNASDRETTDWLIAAQRSGMVTSVTLDNRNTRCLYPKKVFHSMVSSNSEYYVVTDNDFIPCVGWLEKLKAIMDRNPKIGCLALQYWPHWPMSPIAKYTDYVYCRAIGNTFKMCRREAMEQVIYGIPQSLDAFSDDSKISEALRSKGWATGFAIDAYCYNLELTVPNYGYKPEELAMDPRKIGYLSQPETYEPVNWETLEPPMDKRFQ